MGTLLIVAGVPLMLLAGVITIWAAHQAQAAETRTKAAETKAAMAYGNGFRDATDEINKRHEHEAKASYDKGFENGWNAAFIALEDNATVINGGGNDAHRCAAA